MTMPLTSPAVDASTFRPDGVAAGAEGSDEVFELLPPPHAATEVARGTGGVQKVVRVFEYVTPPAKK